MKKTLCTLLMMLSIPAVAVPSDERGLLPEIRRGEGAETENDKKTLQSEILITKAENKAIQSLQSLIRKNAGKPSEPGLLDRLAELYMRRSKTGRFFDLVLQNDKILSSFPVPREKGADSIQKAIEVYSQIERRFPSYPEMDSILFNNAFAHQQLGKAREAERIYLRLVVKFPSSHLIPDASVALGELTYEQRRFEEALKHFARVESYPQSRVRIYALYKAAWAHYNLRDSDSAVDRLLRVVGLCPPEDTRNDRSRQSLRRESLRDLAVFIGDTRDARELYPFFRKITTEDELGQSMMDLAKLYASHSRHKEMNIFLDEFIDRHPDSPHRVKAVLQMLDARETLKDRPGVLRLLQSAGELCAPASRWKARQTAEIQSESCGELYHRATLEIAGKWWEIWQKNKNNVEFSHWTEQALRSVIDNEDPGNPDLKTHFAYAELLFQMNRFDEAADRYHFVGEKDAWEPARRHDADYGALFSLDKALEKKKDRSLGARRKIFAETYLQRHPNGEHAGSVRFKLAQVAYEESDLEAALRWALPLITTATPSALREKAEDLHLDVLNLQKDFKKLEDGAGIYGKSAAPERKKSLQRIAEEARFAGLEAKIRDLPQEQASKLLREFSARSTNEKLTKEALWRSLSLAYAAGRPLQGAEASLDFARRFPQDPRVAEALPETIRGLSEAGRMIEAAETLILLASLDTKNAPKHREAAADFYWLEKKADRSRALYENLLPGAGMPERARLYEKILSTLNPSSQGAEARRLEALILQQNVEPFATRLLLQRAEKARAEGRNAEAFEASRKIISRDAAAELRAEARLIQARILEEEFVRQSMKSSREDKFALVLAMKAEKLEKAQTAYLGASRMSDHPDVQLKSLQGVDRCLEHYIHSLETLTPPPSLAESEIPAFKAEIAKIADPLRSQRSTQGTQMKTLAAKLSASSGAPGAHWAALGAEAPAPVPLRLPASASFRPMLPVDWQTPEKWEFAKNASTKTQAIEKTENPDSRAPGILLLSLSAEQQGLPEKALWLIEAALRLEKNHPALLYQKARLRAQLESTEAAMSDFAKVLDASTGLTELRILRAHRAFSEGDYAAVSKLLNGIAREPVYDLDLGVLHSESIAAQGDPDKALRLLDELAAKKTRVEIELQKGRLNEFYKIAPVPALESYQRALKLATDPAMKDWLVRKTEYLKTNFKVGLHVTSGD